MVLASNLENMGILDASVVALLGYAVVFFGLILLMCVVTVMGKIFIAKDKKKAELNAAAKATIASVPVAAPAAADGNPNLIYKHDDPSIAHASSKASRPIFCLSSKRVSPDRLLGSHSG